VLVAESDTMYVGVGSDHTDRKVEAYGVTVSKQMCPKPIGRELWRFHGGRKALGPPRAALARKFAEGDAGSTRRRGKRELARPRICSAAPRDSGRELSPGTAMFCGYSAVAGRDRRR